MQARTLSNDQQPCSSSSTGGQSGGPSGSVPLSKMNQSSIHQWSPITSSKRPSYPQPSRPTPQLKSLERESLLNKKTPSNAPLWGQQQPQFSFKPISRGGTGTPQLPVRQAITDDKKV